MSVLELDTPHGPARVHLHPADGASGALVLGHGAGGSVDTADLRAATAAATALGVAVALVEQPYRVAGRRSPAPARQLDAAWTSVIEQLFTSGPLAGLALVAGGRSAGARVACRTADATGAVAVLCLAFPLHPPRRRAGAAAQTRLPELDAVTVPVLVVQGRRDPFGMPPPGPAREVVEVAGTHSLAPGAEELGRAVSAWLPPVLEGARE